MQNDSAVWRLAQQRIIAASADIEAQLTILSGTRPVVIVLMMARNEAAAALADLAMFDLADITNVAQIRKLQNVVTRYDDLIVWFRKIVSDGFDYDAEMNANDREEMLDLLRRTPETEEQEIIELGLANPTEER